ncbi:hypothetical protein [Aquimarina sp. LLG6339-5]|uniref:hypothetical protein n=1 Tax=Aquimarina sp. LLG6339-5 TaxID=3160830 RepID=UPI003865EA19
MKINLTLFLAFISLTLFGQSEVGIGIVSINFDDKTKVEFYESSDLDNVLKTVEFFNDESIKSWNIKNIQSHKDWLKPESMWLDYGQFRFRCKTKKLDSFEIYVSESQTMWIKNQKFCEFNSWEDYLKNMFSIERIDQNTQKIYSRPFTKSEVLESKSDCFKLKQMRDEWIEIETASHCESKKKISGWIKWREGNKILINYYTTS